jgi:hypothetical protein
MRKSASVQKVPYLAPDVVAKTIPAPVDGWDAISPLAEMDPKRAPILNNWVPRPGFVEMRGGYFAYAYTGVMAAVESLMVYRSPSSEQMFAAADAHIIDVSTSTGSTVLTGLGSARWQYTNFTPGGSTTSYLQAVNGIDALIQYDGSAWTNPSITGLPGGNTANIINIHAQKQRLWYVMNQSTVVAFMPVGAIQGPIAGTLDFGSLWNKGGYLVSMSSWTVDGGSGPNDYAMFISSRGQVSLYSGVDPTNASDFHLVGTFDISPPIGRRCLTRLGSDVAIITQQGVIPISQALPFDPSADRSIAITARIQNAMAQASITGQSLFGWEVTSFPIQQLLLLNVPMVENQQQVQFVMNTLTGAWCQFIGWNANTFAIYNNNLYWGSNNGLVNQGYVGSTDNAEAIFADMQCAFNWFDEPGRNKRITMVQPLLSLGGGITPTLGVDTDFQTSGLQAPITTFTSTVLWDQALWDQSLWPSTTVNFSSWLTVNAEGHALALRMQVNAIGVGTGSAAFDSAVFDTGRFAGSIDPTLPVVQVNAFNSVIEYGGPV